MDGFLVSLQNGFTPSPDRLDLRAQIKVRFEVEVHERTVGKLLRRLRMTRLQPRPHHPKQDLAAQEAFRRTSPP